MIDSAVFLDQLIKKATEQNNTEALKKLHDSNFMKSVNDVSEIMNELGYLRSNVRDIASNTQNEIYSKIANALIRNFFTVYYVNINTGLYIGYTTNENYKTLKISNNGTDFFNDAEKNIYLTIYPDDQEKMADVMTKDFLIKATKDGSTYKVNYRLLLNNIPTHVSLTAMMITDEDIIIGVSNIEDLAIKEREYKNLIKENLTYANIALALSRNYFSIYYVNTVTDRYEQYNLDDKTQKLEKIDEGDDFFSDSMDNSKKYIYKEDLDKFQYAINKENLINELTKGNALNLTYRQLLNGVPTYVSLKAINLFNDINHIVLAVCNIDEQKRKENEFNQRFEQERVFARTDALTGTYNRNYFIEVEDDLNNKIKNKTVKEFSAIVCDINDLKTINDTYGHNVGDQFIKDAASMLKDAFKESLLFRVGGDEFVIIVSGNDYKHRVLNLTKLQKANATNKTNKKVIVACGMSDFDPSTDETLDDIIKRADFLMYENKKKLKAKLASNYTIITTNNKLKLRHIEEVVSMRNIIKFKLQLNMKFDSIAN